MDCALSTLQAFIACFSWSNIYLDTGLSYQDAGVYVQSQLISTRIDHGEPIVSESMRLDMLRRNPYGSISVGYELRLRSMTLRLEAAHKSSFADGDDKGINYLTIGARWFPFRN